MDSKHHALHSLKTSEAIQLLQSNINGLTSHEASARLHKHGPNELGRDKNVPVITIFLRQFKNIMVYILAGAAAISFYYGHVIDTAVILGIVILNATIGFIQEYRAEKAVAALKKLVVQKVKAYRDNQIQEIYSHAVVPGDILLLEEGDRVPADGRVLSATTMQTQESALTGESLPVDKTTEVLPQETPMAELTNMVFNGTVVVRGFGTILVTATGSHTALGAIAKDIQHIDEGVTHFQSKSSELTRQMAAIAIVTAAVTFFVGFFIQNISLEEILPFTLAALVSAIPESLPLVLMIVLTLSAHRMARKNAIVRHLTAAETLGVVNVIITDKTGTLTQNKMSVEKMLFGSSTILSATKEASKSVNKRSLEQMVAITSLCNSVRIIASTSEEKQFAGDPTEKAFYSYAQSIDPEALIHWEKIEDVPFNQEIKARGCLVKNISTHVREVFVVGAPESLLSRCSFVMVNGKKIKMTPRVRTLIESNITKLTDDAMRVIGAASKVVPTSTNGITEKSFHELVWVGALGMIDPPRVEAAESVKRAQAAGIRVIMATGDHPSTAIAISRIVGISSQSYALTAADMEKLSDAELEKKSLDTNIFARMTPQSKLRLSRILQKQGMILAMTGDGVNDAPALKGADVGVSMGKAGTDVAREASDIVLADDNFATIVGAIEEGRTQFRNMRRTSFFLITTNVAESVSLLTFLFLGLPIPLLPKQILWLNLVGGGVTDLALATEPIHEDVLRTPPRSSHEKILTKQVVPLLILFTLLMTSSALVYIIGFRRKGQ